MKAVYLNRMGITQWQLRNPAVSNAFFQVHLKNAAGKTVGVMTAEIDSAVSIEPQEQLLRKIAEAITVHYDCQRCEQPEFFDEKYQFIIFLGKKIVFDAKKAGQVICANTLSELIHHASMKKTLWTEIKKWRDLFNE